MFRCCFYCRASPWNLLEILISGGSDASIVGGNGKYTVPISEARTNISAIAMASLGSSGAGRRIERTGKCGRDCDVKVQYMTW